LLTVIAMLAFAGNSLLCRLALGNGLIDAASFSSLRVISGAVMLGGILLIRRRPLSNSSTDWRAATLLFTYIAFFSFAYLSLGAGVGALILFGCVQVTMFAYALKQGERFNLVKWLGLGLAVSGLIYLIAPGMSAPDLFGSILMAIAGIAWGIYSILGRGTTDPLEATAKNFSYAIPLVLLVSFFFMTDLNATPLGILWAVMSGAITSGCGYVIWYAALPRLTAIQGATVQLSVPALASFGGVVFLSEDLTLRLIIASVATLSGVAMVLIQRLKP
jgi:drug/metabolite transporter (DMT)-like permease